MRCSSPEACNFIKNRPRHSCFSVNFVKLIKTTLLQNSYKMFSKIAFPKWDKFGYYLILFPERQTSGLYLCFTDTKFK